MGNSTRRRVVLQRVGSIMALPAVAFVPTGLVGTGGQRTSDRSEFDDT
jgi:hypothetical protein